MSHFTVGDRAIGPDEPTFVIAEAGSNHNGDFDTAKRLIDVAVDAGADAVKFQTFRASKMYPEDGELEFLDDQSAHDIFEHLEMPYDWIPRLHEYARSQGVYFMSTPFDRRSADELAEFVPAFKVASSLVVHHPFLEYLSTKDKPVIMSTGAKDLKDIAEAMEVLRNKSVEELVLLQCTTSYPTPLDKANLRVIETLRSEFDVLTGLSDHTVETSIAPIAAVALGASVIEKHFTLDRSMEGPDHTFALEPVQLDQMVTDVRDTEAALGTGEKRILDVEEETPTGEPCLHATEDISEGDTISDTNTAFLRPADDEPSILPSSFDEILGTEVTEDIKRGEKIRWHQVS